MKMLRIPRTLYQYTHNSKQYQEIYFGNLISSTATASTQTEWVDGTAYNMLDEVYIPELNTVYTAKVDNPVGHPSVSRGWFAEGKDAHKMLDGVFSTATVFDGVCEVEFEVVGMSHILGRGISNAKEVSLEYYNFAGEILDVSFNCDACGEIETLVTMTYDDEFDCFKCCNPDPIVKDSFVIPLDSVYCEELYKVKITITKNDETLPILISSMCVANEYDFGCVNVGFSISDKIPAQVSEFPELGLTGIAYANMTSSMRGTISIDSDKVDAHRRVKKEHGGYLNYFLFEEVDAVQSGLLLGLATDTEYIFNNASVTEMSFEAIGVEH